MGRRPLLPVLEGAFLAMPSAFGELGARWMARRTRKYEDRRVTVVHDSRVRLIVSSVAQRHKGAHSELSCLAILKQELNFDYLPKILIYQKPNQCTNRPYYLQKHAFPQSVHQTITTSNFLLPTNESATSSMTKSHLRDAPSVLHYFISH